MTHLRPLRDRLRAVWVDERGVGYVTTATMMLLALTAVACISLLVDGGRITSANRQADLISFQAARSAAQQLDPGALRSATIVITSDAEAAATSTVDALLARANLNGQLTGITVSGRRITVTVTIERDLTALAVFGASPVTVTGTGTVRIGAGVTSEETPLP
jgi:Tfp pilus assembly protein PilX